MRSQREDFPLDAVPRDSRAPGSLALFSVILGIPSALVFLSVGGALQTAYGTASLLSGLLVASVIIGIAGWALTSYACRTGLDSDLMSIPLGFGRRGSALTSCIYAANFVVLFALEDGIIASALQQQWPAIPKFVIFVGLALVVLGLAWKGVSGLAPTMLVTFPVFAVLMILLAHRTGDASSVTEGFLQSGPSVTEIGAEGWLAVLAALLAFVVNATVAADVGRFLRPEHRVRGAVLFGGVLQVTSFFGATLFGGWLAWRLGGNSDPGSYLPGLLGAWGILCVLVSQTRINLINAYSGSLSAANFAARAFGWRIGRRHCMVILVAVATALAMSDVYGNLVAVLTFEAIFVMAWVSVLVTNVWRDADHPNPEIEGAPDVEWVGVSALLLAVLIAAPLAFGAMGELGKAVAPLTAMIVASATTVVGDLMRVSRPVDAV
ncbi:hypothetical protein OJ998_10840 [Solirubrobacter taibaiensis]|nr:hypothetical protein [Solirubrobacter taibaiensis]